MTIPKIIHYCWFGGQPEPEFVARHLATWRRYAPDFEIRRWDEQRFDCQQLAATREAYAAKRFDLVSDYVRLYALREVGGIYLDVDVELLRPLTPLLNNQAFLGLEDFDTIASGLICGATKHEPNITALAARYEAATTRPAENCVAITTAYFRQLGFKPRNRLQLINGVQIYPTKYFCPLKYGTTKARVTPETISIHHYRPVSLRRRWHIILGQLGSRLLGRQRLEIYLRKLKQLKIPYF